MTVVTHFMRRFSFDAILIVRFGPTLTQKTTSARIEFIDLPSIYRAHVLFLLYTESYNLLEATTKIEIQYLNFNKILCDLDIELTAPIPENATILTGHSCRITEFRIYWEAEKYFR